MEKLSCFILLLMLLASRTSSAEVTGNVHTTNQFTSDSFSSSGTVQAAPRETFTDPWPSESAFTSAPSGTSFYASDYTPVPAPSNVGFGTNVGFGLPNPNNLISIGLNIVVGLFFISLIIQILTKVAASNVFVKLFGTLTGEDDAARFLTPDNIDMITNFAVDAIHKFNERYV